MRQNKIPRWELWLDALVVGVLFGFGVSVALLPVLWMVELI